MSGYTYEELAGPDGKARPRRLWLEMLVSISDDAIKDVYFHEFVMQ